HTALWDPGGAAGLKNVCGQVSEAFGNPAANRAAAKPLILERRKLSQIGKRADLFSRIPAQLRSKIQPEKTTGFAIEMPFDDIPHMRIQALPGILNPRGKFDFRCCRTHPPPSLLDKLSYYRTRGPSPEPTVSISC